MKLMALYKFEEA